MRFPIYGGNSLKQFILLQALKEEAHKQLSYYRQKQDDLVARMATEWPTWGCTLDFYSHMILPLLKNSFILNFMNRSEGFGLGEVEVKFGYAKAGKLKFVEEEFHLPAESKSQAAEPDKIKADLVDFCLSLLTNVTDIRIRTGSTGVPVSEALSEWRIVFRDRDPLLVRIRDADIGAQSFFALLEGIMRNASKHGRAIGLAPIARRKESEGPGDLTEKTFRVRIVFCPNLEELERIVELDVHGQDDADNYAFIVVSVSRDLIVDPVTTLERTVGDRPLVDFLTEQFNEGIIDSKGKVSPGNWGIKEMKTCAAFLGGEPLYAVADRQPKFILVGNTIGNEFWDDGLTRICYVVRVEKPRSAIALVPENKRPSEHWEGVRFVTTLSALPKGNVDYDFLYIDQEWTAATQDNLPNRSTLPQRIVCGNYFPRETERKADRADAGEPPLPKELELSYWLYDEVLSQCLETLGEKGREFRLRIYFEDNDRACAWEKIIKTGLQLKDDRKIEVDFLKLADRKFMLGYDSFQASIFRHTQLSGTSVLNVDRGEQVQNSYFPYYAQQVSGSDPFFSFLLSLEPGDNRALAGLVIRQIAEATLLNILIIDERIAQSLGELRAKDEPDIPLARKLCWMGIHVAGSVNLAGDPEPIWAADQKEDSLPDISLDREGFITNTVGNNLPIHILLIHATRLNGIFERLRDRGVVKEKEDLLQKLRARIPSVIVHSGRGKTEGDIPDSAPFLEYSTVEKYVLNEPSKFYLVQIARNVKGDRK